MKQLILVPFLLLCACAKPPTQSGSGSNPAPATFDQSLVNTWTADIGASSDKLIVNADHSFSETSCGAQGTVTSANGSQLTLQVSQPGSCIFTNETCQYLVANGGLTLYCGPDAIGYHL